MSHKHMFVAPWVSLYVEIFINNDLVVIINTAIYVSTYLSHFFSRISFRNIQLFPPILVQQTQRFSFFILKHSFIHY